MWYVAQMANELGQPLHTVAARVMPDGDEVTFEDFEAHVATRQLAAVTLHASALTLGVAGELQGMVKKILRGDPATQAPEYRERLGANLTDVLVTMAAVASSLDVPLGTIAQDNLDKLADRATRGVSKGAGDHR
jgi:NTP pyrophosphatase (non-canonical NTP hydrolase)